LTDKLKGSERLEKKFAYIFALTKECRKALIAKFNREYKGLPFDSIDSVMRREVESWFTIRDRHIELNHDESMVGKPGKLFVTYLGSTKETCFKIHINSLFTLADSSSKSPSYLKSLNLTVDKREFNKK
jgi:hypothetical protein